MSFDWEKFQQEAQEEANRAKAAVAEEVAKVEKFYRDKFEQAQQAAIEARDPSVGAGESPEEYAARIAAVPGSFSSQNQSAIEVVHGPRVQAAQATAGLVTPVHENHPEAPAPVPSSPVTVVPEAPVSEQEVEVTPEPEPQPEQPVPEPSNEPEVTPEPEVVPVEEPVVEPQSETPAEPVTEAPAA